MFNSALLLINLKLADQTPETFKQVAASKVNSTLNLDRITREQCPELDNFVCFSSMAAGRGSPGSSNYGYANSAMERICEQRKRDGLSGLAIQLGAVGDVGVMAERFKGNDVDFGGNKQQRIASVLNALDTFMRCPYAVVSSTVFVDTLQGVRTEGDSFAIFMNILGVKDSNNVNEQTTISELGLDSLIAVKMRQVLELNHGIVINTNEMRAMTVGRLKVICAESINAV